jgi:hypothetical protein
MSSRTRKPRVSYKEASSDDDWLGSDADEGASGGSSDAGGKSKGRKGKAVGDSYGASE